MLNEDLHTASGERFARVGELELCYETFGADDAPPLLLVMGLGAQMVLWDTEFCEALAERGFRVIRFDNRDVGRSTILRGRPVPSRRQLLLRDPKGAAYSLEEMADDTAGLLTELEIERAHVVGASMGGMIVQLLAINHPDRVASMVSIMSTTGSRRVGWASPRMYKSLLGRPRRDRAGYVEDFVKTYQLIGAKRYPPDVERLQRLGELCFDRGYHASGTARQLAAIAVAPDRSTKLAGITAPTTVIHGDADPLVSVSGGKATAKAIPDARLLVLPGMGHHMPPALWPELIDAICDTAARAAR